MDKKRHLFYYLMGFITASIVVGVIGSDEIIHRLYVFKVRVLEKNKSQVLDIPRSIRDEFQSKGIVFDNYDVKMHDTKHDTILVKPDPVRRFKLRPNVHIEGYMLEAKNAFNLEPPGIYMLHGTEISDDAKRYLDKNTRVRYSYTVDSKGFRTTVPELEVDKKWLIVGDSVAFGVGVSDDETIASYLQASLQNKYQIVNGGVGSYHTNEVLMTSKQLLEENRYEGLVYIACQNDFLGRESWKQLVTHTLKTLKALTQKHDSKFIVVLQTYLQYNLNDFLGEQGWSAQRIHLTDLLRETMRELTEQEEITYMDWFPIVRKFRDEQKTIFAPFVLYVDHNHLSPLGSKLVAEELAKLIH